MNQRPVLAVAAAATLLVTLLAGCGDDTVARSEPAADELAQHDGEPCPEALPQGAADAAADTPEFVTPDEAWICRYDSADAPADGGDLAWERRGEPRSVPADRLPDLVSALSQLAPAPDDQMCTMDLGPRYLLVLSEAGDLTGVAVDAFGCGDVRVTDEPFETAPGQGEFPGVLSGPASLVEDLQDLYGD